MSILLSMRISWKPRPFPKQVSDGLMLRGEHLDGCSEIDASRKMPVRVLGPIPQRPLREQECVRERAPSDGPARVT